MEERHPQLGTPIGHSWSKKSCVKLRKLCGLFISAPNTILTDLVCEHQAYTAINTFNKHQIKGKYRIPALRMFFLKDKKLSTIWRRLFSTSVFGRTF